MSRFMLGFTPLFVYRYLLTLVIYVTGSASSKIMPSGPRM
jgi:hypothetical protein